MGTKLMGNTVRRVMDEALAEAEAKAVRNHIHTRVHRDGDGEVVTKLTVVLNGVPGSWINYNGEQLDGLIALLQANREKMRTL